MQLILSLFPGIGLLDMAFEEEGYCVVRGPDLLWGGNVKHFRPPAGKFEGVIGGPPCKAFTRLRHIIEANGYELAENLIPEFERCVIEAQPAWYLMENVPDAPGPVIPAYYQDSTLLEDSWCGGETSRLRRFSFGRRDTAPHGWRFQPETLALHCPDPARAVTCDMRQIPVALLSGGKRKKGLGGTVPRTGRSGSLEQMAELQGVPGQLSLSVARARRLHQHSNQNRPRQRRSACDGASYREGGEGDRPTSRRMKTAYTQ